jgi:predicted kinase
MPRLVVISGPANSGKMPLAKRLMAEDPGLICVHRDYLRTSFVNQVDEWHITALMADLARGILRMGLSPIAVAWNMEPVDRELWADVASEAQVRMEWLDVREPHVAAMIPLMDTGSKTPFLDDMMLHPDRPEQGRTS